MENKPEVDEQLIQLVSNLTQESIQRMNQTAEELRKELGLPPEAKYDLLHMLFGSESNSSPSTEQPQSEKSTEQPLLVAAREGVSRMKSYQSQMFGTYQVIKPIGNGGFAQVYLVEDDHGHRWALKHIREDRIKQDPGFRERFEREARKQMGLKHDHIVGVHDFDASEGYLVIDYVEGRTLQTLLDEDYPDGMDLDTARKILEPIEKALTYVHKERSLAHLDITPKNILIQERHTQGKKTEWDPRLADFGLARVVGLDGKAEGTTSQAGWGTPAYLAPEQVDRAKGTPGLRSDIYALGLMIGVMLTGRNALEVRGILRGTNNTLPPRLPLEVKQVLQRATEENPENRYATVKGLITAFTRAVEEYKFRQPVGVGDPAATVLASPTLPVHPTRDNAATKNQSSQWPKTIVASMRRYYSIVVTVVLLVFVAWALVRSLPVTYSTKLGGLDLGIYCTSLGYAGNNGVESCSSKINLDKACDWQHETIGLHFHLQKPTDPTTGTCLDAQENPVGGIKDMSGYCQDQRNGFLGMPEATTVGTTWVCEQKIDPTLVCMWQYDRTDVQARKNDTGLWACYGP
jgi:serine/threonine protein kinase